VSTLGGRSVGAPSAEGSFAVYSRLAGADAWRLDSVHPTGHAAERRRAGLYWQVVAGWRIEQTMVMQYPPGTRPAACVEVRPRKEVPPLEARRVTRAYTKERQISGAEEPSGEGS
jgi:hypothetical protein